MCRKEGERRFFFEKPEERTGKSQKGGRTGCGGDWRLLEVRLVPPTFNGF
jgi:hypothetical protein